LRREEHGYTFDSVVNRMIRQHEQARYDRVMASIDETALRPESIDLLGSEPLSGADSDSTKRESGEVAVVASGNQSFSTPTRKTKQSQVFMSDHFGLLAQFGVSLAASTAVPAAGEI